MSGAFFRHYRPRAPLSAFVELLWYYDNTSAGSQVPVDGDRSGAVEDHSGNQGWIATRKENLSDEELARRMAARK